MQETEEPISEDGRRGGLRQRPRNAVPPPDPRRERWVRVVAVVTIAYWCYYIVWRWGWTLNPDALWFAVPLAAAETWGLIATLVTVHSVWRIRYRQPLEPPAECSVDVFITCYDEPLEVIRRTAVGARAIRYPHETWILDDGARDEVRQMAADLGVGYLRREGNEHAKAGNLNHALRHTRGEYILQLDADHVPLPHILHRVLGFFDEDPRLAFVQTPQDFYNTDAFTYAVDETSRRIWEEQRLFFGVIQPGKDSINSTFFCGCSAVIRREALDSIGGFSTGTITEDIETSLRLHAAGWNSAYYGESLVYGLAAHSAVAFHTQHLRWGQGAMQVMRRLNPLTVPGLTLDQRISYFGSLTAYVGGLQKLVFYAAPPVFFFTGILPINALNAAFLARFVPFLGLSLILGEVWARGRSRAWIAERFHMVKFWTYTRAVLSVFSRKPRRFNVTPKGPGHVPFRMYAPQAAVLAGTALSAAWALVAARQGWLGYGGRDHGTLAFLTNGVWAAVNCAVAAAVVRMSLTVRQQRGDHRFRDRFPVRLRLASPGGRTRTRVGMIEDLNAAGISVRTAERLDEGERVRLTLPLSTASVRVEGRIAYSRPVSERGAGMHRTGIALDPLPVQVRDQIELHCTQHAVPLEQSRYAIGPRFVARTLEWARNTRGEARRRVGMPARVRLGARGRTEVVAVLEEISSTGARLVMERAAAPETRIRFEVPGTKIRGSGRVVFTRAIETPIGVRFAVGVQRGRRRDAATREEEKQMQTRRLGRGRKAAAIALALAAAAPAAAQVQTVVFGGTEIDAEELRTFLAGVDVSAPGTGLGWTAGVTAYRVRFPVDPDGTAALTVVQPSVGIRSGSASGAVKASVGYAFADGDEGERAVGAPAGGADGVVTTVQVNHWGLPGSATSGQAIAAYNWGADYLWSNLRGARRIVGTSPGPGFGLGAEAGFQGDLGGDDGAYRAFQAGALAEYHVSPALRVTGVVGGKTDNRDASADVFPYVKVEVVALPF